MDPQPTADRGLAPLEDHMTATAQIAHLQGVSEQEYLRRRYQIAAAPTLTGLPHDDAANRLEQAVATLRDAGLWPWA